MSNILYNLKFNTKIVEDYWLGKDTLKYETPWLVPESIIRLDNIDMSDMSVLEFGSGGSTIFFSRRAKMVTSFETDSLWFNEVEKDIKEKKLTNINYNLYKDLNDRIILDKHYDVILIDHDGRLPFSRKDITQFLLDNIDFNNTIVILDNYDAPYCFDSKKIIPKDKEEIYNDPHWGGYGTMIFYSGKYKEL